MSKPETVKATVSLKAESLLSLVDALTRIAEDAGMVIVQNATVTTSIAIDTDDLDDLVTALGDVTSAIERSEGVECKVSAPGSAWHGRRLDATPMERMINSATEPESVTLRHGSRSVTLTAETARTASEMLRKSSDLFEDE